MNPENLDKTFEKAPADMEKLTLAELERMADDTSVAVPETLERKVTDAVLAADVLGETAQKNPEESGRSSCGSGHRPAGRRNMILIPAAAAAVAAVAIGFSIRSAYRTPADTFSSPEEALAHLEKTFDMIGNRAGRGLEVAGRVNPKLQRTYEMAFEKSFATHPEDSPTHAD